MATDHYRGRHRGTTDLAGRPGPLTATALRVEFGGRVVLDEVSLHLLPGTMTALTGPSGAGKSTLLWVLAGALTPSAGTVTYAGGPIAEERIRDDVLLVPQGVGLVTPLTARENVVVALLVGGVPPDEARRRADQALEQVRLGDAGDHLVEELSGGQQQRVAVARALALRRSVLLADEPTSELDAGTRETVVECLRAEADAGATVLLATHDPWCAEQADAEYHLDEGRISRVR